MVAKKPTAEWEADQAKGVEELVRMFVKGGYHRARISAIDDFDKIAGGMAWCIASSRLSIDVEFVENANIGQKLKVGENIEDALVAMQCPHELQAHQIQGMDVQKIIPVVRWLLKRVAAVRKEQQASYRRHSDLLFRRAYGNEPYPEEPAALVPPPQRVYRHPPGTVAADEVEHVRNVLLEYGHTYQVNAEIDILAAAEEEDAKQEQLEKLQQEQAAELEAMQTMMSQMLAVKEKTKMSNTAVDGLLSKQADALAKMLELDSKIEAVKEAALSVDEQAALQKKKEQLARREAKLEAENARHAALQEEVDAVHKALEKSQKELRKKEKKLGKIEDARAEFEAELDADPEKRALFTKVTKLLKKIDEANKRVEDYKEECDGTVQELKAKNAALQQKVLAAIEAGEDDAEIAELTELVTHFESKLKPLQATNKSQDARIQELEHDIDQVPTRAELMQYQKRLAELYEQATWKYQETKLCYGNYNVLTETAKYLSREAEMMKGIREEAVQILQKASTVDRKQALTEGVKEVLQQMARGGDSLRGDLLKEKATLDGKVKGFADLIAAERLYLQNIKSLQEEFAKGDRLQTKIDAAEAELAVVEG